MTSLTLMQGYPGSGKTTLAKEWVYQAVEGESLRAHLSRDDFREHVFVRNWRDGHAMPYAQEQHLTDLMQDAARKLLKRGYDVVIDDLNLRRRYCVEWAQIALEQQVAFGFWPVTTALEICVRRDEQRRAMGGRGVGEAAIREIATKFPVSRWPFDLDVLAAAGEKMSVRAGEWRVYEPPTFRPKRPAVLVDLDGTVAAKSRESGSRGWHEYDRVGEDIPRQEVIDMINLIHNAGAAEVIFMSGRKSYCRPQTQDWLEEHVGRWTLGRPLFMRADDDNREDSIVKHELFDAHVRDHYHVIGAFDDRDRVVAMWRAIGLQVYQVAPGNF